MSLVKSNLPGNILVCFQGSSFYVAKFWPYTCILFRNYFDESQKSDFSQTTLCQARSDISTSSAFYENSADDKWWRGRGRT